MRFEKLMQLTWKFVGNGLARSIFSAFMAACIVMILALSQIIVAFNPGDVIKSELLSSQQSVLALQKNDF